MKNIILLFMIVFCSVVLSATAGTTWYVSLNSATDGPGTAWSNAYHVIQSAVDVAVSGDTVMVEGGIYNTGTNKTPGHLVENRVVITNNITVESASGAAATIIDANGTFTRRGVYMSAGILKGFTITGGGTVTYGDDVYDKSGGGVNLYGGTGKIIDCVVSNNYCIKFGGGVYSGTAERCVIANNEARDSGGGISGVITYSCAVYGNRANAFGGGCYGGVLVNSSISGNSAAYGGGVYNATVTNSIIWDNSALKNENWDKGILAYCCTYPVPPGLGNFTAEPELIDGKHIASSSPCIGAGVAVPSLTTDIDNDVWGTPVNIGCDWYVSPMYSDFSANIIRDYYYVVAGKEILFRLDSTGKSSGSWWSFGDGTHEQNKTVVSHSWTNAGYYSVSVRLYNNTYPSGKTFYSWVNVYDISNEIYYVDINNSSATYPYKSWVTAASNIQDAVDSAEHFSVAGAQVVVTDGVYQVGEKYVSGYFPNSSNRVVVSRDIIVRSVNGPEHTFIKGKRAGTYYGFGDDAVRCVYMSAGHLEGFTLTNGYTRSSGDSNFEMCGGGANLYGGLATISGCVFATNSAYFDGGGLYFGKADDSDFINNYAMTGAGAFRTVVSNCLLRGNTRGSGLEFGYAYNCDFIGNKSDSWGGAAYRCDLYDCNVISNMTTGTSASGGGISYCNFYSGIISNNSSEKYGGGASDSEIYDSMIVSNRSSSEGGGGVYSSHVYRSVIAGNITDADKDGGGGSMGSYLYSCLLYNNSAPGMEDYIIPGDYSGGYGGAANNSQLYNCTVVSNSGANVGGIYGGGAYNCIVRDNSVTVGSNYNYNAVNPMLNCCVSPDPGGSSFDQEPLFMNAAERDYHLRVYSPCVDQGTNLVGVVDDDLNGTARPIDGDVDGTPLWDIGCYEYDAYKTDSDGDEMSDGWEYLNGLNPTNQADAVIDSDGDGVVNIREYVADTSPTNQADFFRITAFTNGSSATVYFNSSSKRVYTLKACSDLSGDIWTDIAEERGVTGVGGDDSMIDLHPLSRIEAYRVKVEVP